MNTNHLRNLRNAAKKRGLYTSKDFARIQDNTGIQGNLKPEFIEKTLQRKKQLIAKLKPLATNAQQTILDGLTPFSLWQAEEAKQASKSTKALSHFLQNLEILYLQHMTKPEEEKDYTPEDYTPEDEDTENPFKEWREVTRNGVTWNEPRY